jgi:transcriptional regulator with XRE-family HTH domain
MDKSRFNNHLGKFLQKKRKELQMSQSDLAAKLGNNSQNISRIERGEISPTLYWFSKLAEVFEQDLSTLILEFEKDAQTRK